MATVGRRGRAAAVRAGSEGYAAAGRRGRRRGAGEGGGAARETEMGEEGGERREPSRGVGEVGSVWGLGSVERGSRGPDARTGRTNERRPRVGGDGRTNE